MLPAFLLLFIPAALIVGLREGILGAEVATRDSMIILLKATAAALSTNSIRRWNSTPCPATPITA